MSRYAMEWAKENTISLIELFREKRVLWDSTFMDFKNRDKKHDAWSELGTEFEIDDRTQNLRVDLTRGLDNDYIGCCCCQNCILCI
jgi:hypothetical protein